MGFEVVPRTAPRDLDEMEAWRAALISEIRAWATSHGGEPPRELEYLTVYLDWCLLDERTARVSGIRC
jgi:hypothetical protein